MENILGTTQSINLCKKTLDFLNNAILELESLLSKIDKPSGSVPVPIVKAKVKPKKKIITKAVNSPSEFHSRSFLKSLIANSGRVDRNDGTQTEYDIEESKNLLWEKESKYYEDRAKEYERNLLVTLQ